MATNFGFLALDGGSAISLTEVLDPISGELASLHDAGFTYGEYAAALPDGSGLPTNFIDTLAPSNLFGQEVTAKFFEKGLTGRIVSNKTTFSPAFAVWADRPFGPDGVTLVTQEEFRLAYVTSLIEVYRSLGIPVTLDFEIQPIP